MGLTHRHGFCFLVSSLFGQVGEILQCPALVTRVTDPVMLPLVALACGIIASRLLGLATWPLAISLALQACITLLASRYSRRMVLPCSLAAVMFLGALIEVLHRPGRPPEIDASARETMLLSGCVVSPPAFYDGRDQFVVELAPGARARVTWTVRDGERPLDLRYGQLVEFEARVRPIRNFQNPGAFDFQAYSARSNIYWTASIPTGRSVVIQSGRCGSRFAAGVFALRTAALNRIDQLYAGNPYATGIMEATLIGEKAKLEKIWTENFRRTGTYHMLVIDGLHITVLAVFLLFLLRICFVPELSALALTALGAWLYSLISGWEAPAVRAAGGFTLYLVARYFYRRGRLINLLATAAIVYLIFDPGQIFEPGFQLSFLAVAAIGALALPVLEATSTPYWRGVAGIAETSRDPRLPPQVAQFRLESRLIGETLHYVFRIPQTWWLRGWTLGARLVLYAWETAVVSTAIQIGVALPMAIYFHRISLTGFSANILAVPLLGVVVPLGFVAIFTGWSIPARIAEWFLIAGEKVADWHSTFEPSWRVADPPLWLSVAFCFALLLLAWAIRKSRLWTRASFVAVLFLFTLVFWHPFPPDTHAGELEVTAIDVGQGDSLLICFPDSKLMLIDGGGVLSFGRRAKPRFDIGEDVVSPYLWRRSIRKLDVIAMTHAHDDHAQGLPAIVENFHPAELWTGAIQSSAAWSALEQKAHAQNVKIVAMQGGRSFDFGGAHIDVLSPPPDYMTPDSPKNNDSLVLRISYGQRSFLLTGDMEKQMEANLVASGDRLRSDVLKVGHHGSNTSSIGPFLDAVAPEFAVISDGFENAFRHPHPQVLERLAAHRAGILRTDQQGLITIRTDGRRISVETFRMGEASHQVYPLSAASAPF